LLASEKRLESGPAFTHCQGRRRFFVCLASSPLLSLSYIMSLPSLCGTFLTGKRSLVAFIWTITTICTYLAFILAIGAIIQVHTSYLGIERNYQEQGESKQNYQQNDDDAGGGDRGSADREQALAQYMWLAALSSTSLTLCAVYIMVMAVALTMYGSTAVVGFMSLRGVYIAPCFSSKGSRLRLGLFGGAVILFVNLLIVCAVVFGEVRVSSRMAGGRLAMWLRFLSTSCFWD
jgi:FtsH-binding integral membrane protein